MGWDGVAVGVDNGAWKPVTRSVLRRARLREVPRSVGTPTQAPKRRVGPVATARDWDRLRGTSQNAAFPSTPERAQGHARISRITLPSTLVSLRWIPLWS